MLKELVQFKERKCKKETMARGYYIHNAITEKEPLERWENEGGRIGQSLSPSDLLCQLEMRAGRMRFEL